MRLRGGVLIVSASVGTGHVRAGEALLQAAHAAGIEAEHVDILKLGPRWIEAVYGGGFELLASRAPRVWRELYRRADGPDGDTARWGALAEAVLFPAFRRLVLARAWDAVVCTHFLPAQLAAGRRGFPPFALVLTDFAEHRFWMQPRVRRYFVATERLAAVVRERVPGAVASATGIPVALPRVGEGMLRARIELGLDPLKPLAVVVGGGWGAGVEEAVASAARADVASLRIVAVCGRNDGARARLEARFGGDPRIRVLGYTDGLPRYLTAADVIVTKPGGLTCSEALALGRPLVLTRPIPGHEEANLRELVGIGAAADATGPGGVRSALEQVFRSPSLLGHLSAAALRAGRPDAAAEIVETLAAENSARATAA